MSSTFSFANIPLTLGTALLAFGPYISLFSLIVYKKAQLLIVATSAALFFLISSTIASLLWMFLYRVIGLSGPYAAIIPGVVSQFWCRCAFVSLYHKVEHVITISLHKHHEREIQRQLAANDSNSNRGYQSASQSNLNNPNNPNNENSHSNTINHSSVSANSTAAAAASNTPAAGPTSHWSEAAKLRLELNDAVSAIAAAVGFGGMHAVLLFGTLLAHQTANNIGVLYQDSCPNVPSLVVSASFTFCFSILDVFWMLFSFFGMRRRLLFHRGSDDLMSITNTSEDFNRNAIYNNHDFTAQQNQQRRTRGVGAYLGNSRNGGNMALLLTLLTHLTASIITVGDALPYGCVVTIPAVAAVVIATMYMFYAGCGRIYMPPPISTTTATSNRYRPSSSSAPLSASRQQTDTSNRSTSSSAQSQGHTNAVNTNVRDTPVTTAATTRHTISNDYHEC